jgi:hypothetical protein
MDHSIITVTYGSRDLWFFFTEAATAANRDREDMYGKETKKGTREGYTPQATQPQNNLIAMEPHKISSFSCGNEEKE